MKYARIVPPEINKARPHNDRFMTLSADSLSIPQTMHVLRDGGYKYLVIAARMSASGPKADTRTRSGKALQCDVLVSRNDTSRFCVSSHSTRRTQRRLSRSVRRPASRNCG